MNFRATENRRMCNHSHMPVKQYKYTKLNSDVGNEITLDEIFETAFKISTK